MDQVAERVTEAAKQTQPDTKPTAYARLTKHEHDLMLRAAAQDGRSMAGYVRWLLREDAKSKGLVSDSDEFDSERPPASDTQFS